MTETEERAIQLTDLRWMDRTLAIALVEAGVTVQTLAGMTGDELLAKYPFVGTINAWLLTSEAEYIMGQVTDGLWDPGEQADLEMGLEDLEALEREMEAVRIRPLMKWPPTPRPVITRSVRVERIRRQAEIEEARQQELQRMRELAELAELDSESEDEQ